ncbi:hypothetical protein [Phytoactinopolyspora halotolerans]|uniref:Glycosyltransferase RgtA/B/C/D-like domain-containing protein n=1 Tax=Phytoactinopolyspora halotolerans TaxID=1981512 RepID=A0A6L9S2L5_9ACTN|nr:hypothetical protein [Phytoactinopolyspora halotolerans]NED99455.1 hypothetical protein [Phytoactinopolyspora halotolerans]
MLLIGVRIWGLHIVATREADLKLRAIPLFGRWAWDLTWWLLVPVLVGALLIAVLPRISSFRPWPAVLASTAAAGVAFSLALALAQTHPEVWTNIDLSYARHIGFIETQGVGGFLGDYTERAPTYPVHLQGHPPGLVLLFWAAAQAGVAGVGFQNALAMLGVAAAAVAVLAVVRDLAGERPARSAAPFLVIAPAAVWHTNADVIFGGFGLAGVACLILATDPATSRGRRAVLTGAGGLLFGAALLLSFGLALLVVPILLVAGWRSRERARGADGYEGEAGRGAWRDPWWPVLAGGAVAAAVVLAPLAGGYWWLEGLQVTRERYYAGVASARGYWYFLVANLAVFALALGPAIAVALSRLWHRRRRDYRVWLVVGSGLAAVALADLSGMSSGETERIWQPFMPLVLAAGCALRDRAPRRSSAGGEEPRDVARWGGARAWLTVQLAVAVLLVAALKVPW